MDSRNKDLVSIKSKYILKQIFQLLLHKKFLKIINYNKNLQNRLDLSIKDYKEYEQVIIEVDIDKAEFNLDGIENYFLYNKIFDKSYFHIYFDGNKEEIKRPYITLYEKVKKVKIIIDYEIKSFENLFYGCEKITKINFIKFSRKDITNMKSMFEECLFLEKLNLSNFNTDNVIDMSYMFYKCSSLKELNLSNFNTNNVVNMSYMFNGCIRLKELNLSNFNTNREVNMSYMFSECSSLEVLNIINFNTNKVTKLIGIFSSCFALKNIFCNDTIIKKLFERYKIKYKTIEKSHV